MSFLGMLYCSSFTASANTYCRAWASLCARRRAAALRRCACTPALTCPPSQTTKPAWRSKNEIGLYPTAIHSKLADSRRCALISGASSSTMSQPTRSHALETSRSLSASALYAVLSSACLVLSVDISPSFSLSGGRPIPQRHRYCIHRCCATHVARHRVDGRDGTKINAGPTAPSLECRPPSQSLTAVCTA